MMDKQKRDVLFEIEQRMVRLMEVRGVAAFPWKDTLRKIERWVENEFVKPFFINKDKYVFNVPENLTKEIDFIEDLEIIIELMKDKNGMHKSGGGTNTTFFSNRLSREGKMSRGKIKITGFFYKRNLFPHTVYISLYHELNHAYESYIDLRKHAKDLDFETYNGLPNRMPRFVKTSVKGLVDVNIDGLSPEDNASLNEIAYRLFSETELNALIASVYGDFEARKSARKNFSEDYKRTQAYTVYQHIAPVYKTLFNKLDDRQILDYIAALRTFGITFNPYGENSADSLRKELIRKVIYLLKKLIRGIGRVASLYYDETEREEREKLIGNDGSITIR